MRLEGKNERGLYVIDGDAKPSKDNDQIRIKLGDVLNIW